MLRWSGGLRSPALLREDEEHSRHEDEQRNERKDIPSGVARHDLSPSLIQGALKQGAADKAKPVGAPTFTAPGGLCFQPEMPVPRSNPKWTKARLRTKPTKLKQVTTAKSETPGLEAREDGRINLSTIAVI
jgi:hypothetical protein